MYGERGELARKLKLAEEQLNEKVGGDKFTLSAQRSGRTCSVLSDEDNCTPSEKLTFELMYLCRV